MTIANPSKALILLVALLSLAGCADRTRTNCVRTKNKLATSTLMQVGGGRCG